MTSFAKSLTDAVTAVLVADADEFTESFTPTTKLVPRWTLEDLATLRVSVCPGAFARVGAARGGHETGHDIASNSVYVLVQKRIGTDEGAVDEDDVDALLLLVEQIIGRFRKRAVTATSKRCVCTARETIGAEEAANVGFDRDILANHHVFNGVIKLDFAVLS